MLTVHEFIEHGWAPPHLHERMLSLTQVRDSVVIITERHIWRARRDPITPIHFTVALIGHI